VSPARIGFWLLSVLAFAFLGYGLWIEPPPLWFVLVALLGYATYSTLGVLFPHLEMYGKVLWRGPSGRREVALSFDDGPHPETTRKVLEILKAHGQVATFFVVGTKAEACPDVVREIVAAGHGLGLHGYTHDRLYSLRSPRSVQADIEQAQRALEAVCGERPRLFRPPVGFASHRTLAGAKRAKVEVVGCSARGLDGMSGRDPERVTERVVQALRDGAIVLLHDAAERDDFTPATIAALPKVLEAIAQRGLKTVRIDSWL